MLRTVDSLNALTNPLQYGDTVELKGVVYTLRQDMNPMGWTLFAAGWERHPRVQRIPSMVELIALVVRESEAAD